MDPILTGSSGAARSQVIRALQQDVDVLLTLPPRHLCDDTHKLLMLQIIDRAATTLKVSGTLPANIIPHLVKAHKGAIAYETSTVFRHLCEAIDIYLRRHLPRLRSPAP